MYCIVCASYLFFFTATSTTEIYTLSLHDALPILAGGVDRVDTLVVVAGSTKPLPSGGTVADALYHSRTDRLYMTNIQRNQLEVFSLTDSSFKSPVIVGSRPWGITSWPRNRGGTMGDTLLVANSGGTDISYVNLRSEEHTSELQ